MNEIVTMSFHKLKGGRDLSFDFLQKLHYEIHHMFFFYLHM